ncbi:cytotoxin, partial [Vibrio mimicus]
LKGKGIIGGSSTTKLLPFKCDILKDDANGTNVCNETKLASDGVRVILGPDIISSQLIPGVPLGQFFNVNALGDKVKTVYLPNGDRGLRGLKNPISELSNQQVLLFTNGALSGCMCVVAKDNKNLYMFHVGKHGNDTSPWSTNTDGARMVLENAEKLVGATSVVSKQVSGIQDLVDFCSENFNQTVVLYCGHGEKYKSRKNVELFDYNIPQKGNPLRVGNSVTLVSNVEGRTKISTLCDDMVIDPNSCNTTSVLNKIVSFM